MQLILIETLLDLIPLKNETYSIADNDRCSNGRWL